MARAKKTFERAVTDGVQGLLSTLRPVKDDLPPPPLERDLPLPVVPLPLPLPPQQLAAPPSHSTAAEELRETGPTETHPSTLISPVTGLCPLLAYRVAELLARRAIPAPWSRVATHLFPPSCMLGICLVVWHRVPPLPPRDEPQTPGRTGEALATGMLFGSIAALANLLLMLAGGTDDGSAGIASTALKLDVTGLAAVTHIVFLAPIAEEAAFRGIIYRLFRRSMLPLGAITVSAIIFAVMHVQPATALWALFLGIGAGVCYEQTRSLLAPILVHALFNAVPVGVAVIRTMPEDLGPLWLILAVAAIVFSFSAASAGRIAD